MVIEGYQHEGTGFPRTLETWRPEGHDGPIITFILRPDRKLQAFWRRDFPREYPLTTKRGPRAMLVDEPGRPWLYVRLY